MEFEFTLRLTRDEAAALHDLIVDASMNGGRVAYPVPLSTELADKVADACRRVWNGGRVAWIDAESVRS